MINFIRPRLNSVILAILMYVVVLLVSACARAQEIPFSSYIPGNNANEVLEDSEARSAQTDQAIKREVTVTVRVKKILPEDVRDLPHQRFLIQLSNGSTVLIAHDLKYAPAVPIHAGDVLCIHGEYIWNKLGGLIHWTHHSDTFKHESGWIDFKGTRYQ